jgi:hypothetical protein
MLSWWREIMGMFGVAEIKVFKTVYRFQREMSLEVMAPEFGH